MARVTKKRTGGISAGAPAGGNGGGGGGGGAQKKRGGGVVLGYRFPEFGGPPPGTFDPGLEAQVRSSQRGLLDLIEQSRQEGHRQHVDVSQKRRENRRSLVQGRGDLGLARGDTLAEAGYRRGQLDLGFERALQDLGIAKQRGEEDYQRTLVDLQHRFGQAEQDRMALAARQGTAEAGSSQASAAVRGANQAHDTGEVNRQHTEDVEDLLRREGRLRQDYGSDVGHLGDVTGRNLRDYAIQGRRLGQDFRSTQHALSLAALRANQDRATKLSHAKREQGIYQTDVAQQAFYQAHQTNPSIIYPSSTGSFAPHTQSHAPRAPGVGRAISYPRRRY
jgi:hypothetical protein